MRGGPDPVPRRLRTALRAYPRHARETEGEVLMSLARDLVDAGSSVNREALGLLRSGLVARAGVLADAPWEDALRRVALPIAVAFLAIAGGAAAAGLRDFSWPGWSWIAVLAAPALAVMGLLAGRRAPVALGAVMLVGLGVAQGNSRLAQVHLVGSMDWAFDGAGAAVVSGGGYSLPLLSCAISGALLLLAAAGHARRPASARSAAATLAWVLAGATVARLMLEPEVALTVGGVRLDGLGVCMAAYAVATIAVLALGVARRRSDPAGMLAGTLAVATVLPAVTLYGVSALPVGTGANLALLASSAIAIVIVLLQMVRLTPTTLRPRR